MSADSAIAVQGLTYAYPGGPAALQDVSFRVEPGARVALVGPNGAGKTTLFLALAGVLSLKPGMARLAATGGGTAAYALLGLLFALVRQAAGGLLAAIIAHGVLDVLMFAGMFVRRRQLRAMAGGARTA